ncbi:polyamine ABC transporter substrate-binding protein [Pseudomonas aeruginosa]|uniref:polyamine ABC transporter substrate-binding protein n=1 Tax=Pseudomonas aeruginosa TaxID=287 RepID=UPI003BF315A1
MNKILAFSVFAFSVGLSAVQAEERSSGNVVNIYNWGDYIDPALKDQFQKDSGIKVVYDVFDTNETLEGKLLSGNTGYDLVVPSNQFLARQIKAGVYRKLDKGNIPNLSKLDPTLLKKIESSDPGNAYGVPYLWASTGIIYNPVKVKEALGTDVIDSWSAVFDVENIKKLSKCGVAFLDSPDEIFPSALLYLGWDPNTTNQQDYKKAEDLLMKVKPYVTYFNSSKHVSDLANGNICVAIGYSGDPGMINSRAEEAKNGIHVSFAIPKEGAKLSVDMMAIPADAKNPENAEKFINFVLEPKVMAAITNYVHYPNAVPDSKQFTSPEIANDPVINPSEVDVQRLVVAKVLPPNVTRALTRSWNKIKSGN